MDSTEVLLTATGNRERLRTRRSITIPVFVGSQQVLLRDQVPLHPGNVEFQGGWEFEDLVAALNRRVFFWSGWKHKPISYGVRHFERYQSEKPLILRVRFEDLQHHNAGQVPFFCKYNSGAPRRVQGKASPRGPDTFLSADRCPYNPGDVVEVTFLDSVKLPESTEFSDNVVGPWTALFTSV